MLPVMASWCWTTPALRRAVSSRFHSLCRSAVSSGVRKAKSPSAACSGPCACCEIALSRGRLVKYPAAVSHSQQRSGGNAAAAMHAADSTGGQRQKCKLPPQTQTHKIPPSAPCRFSAVFRGTGPVSLTGPAVVREEGLFVVLYRQRNLRFLNGIQILAGGAVFCGHTPLI